MKALHWLLFKGKEIPFVEQITGDYEVQQIISRYSFAAQFVKERDTLEVACGSGHGGYYFMRKGAKSVIGGDLRESSIAYARANYVNKGLSFQVLNAAKLPFKDSSFDTIISIETLEHVVGYKDFIRECSRVLRDGGVFVCSTPFENRTENSYFLKKLTVVPDEQNFTSDSVRTLMEDYFKEINIYGTGRASSYMDYLIIKLGSFLKYLSYSYPMAGKVIKFVTNNKTLRRYHPMQLPKVDDFDRMLESEYVFYPLAEDKSESPHTIIAVAYK